MIPKIKRRIGDTFWSVKANGKSKQKGEPILRPIHDAQYDNADEARAAAELLLRAAGQFDVELFLKEHVVTGADDQHGYQIDSTGLHDIVHTASK